MIADPTHRRAHRRVGRTSVFVAALIAALAGPGFGATFTVTDGYEAHAAAPGNGICLEAGQYEAKGN